MPGRPSSRELAAFGKRLRAEIERSAQFDSRAAFVRHHDLEGATLYRYETGERQPPLSLVQAFADSLGVPIDRLTGPGAEGSRTVRDDALGPTVLEELIAERGVDADVAARARTMSLHSGMATRLEAGAVLDAAASILARERSGGPPPPNDPRAVIDTASGQRARTRAPRRT